MARTSRKRTSRRGSVRRNPPALYRAIGVDGSGRRHPLGTGPLAAMRETAMATWLSDPSIRSAYVVDKIGHSYLTLEPRDRKRLAANPVDPDLHEYRGFAIRRVDATQLGYRVGTGSRSRPGTGRKEVRFYISSPDDPQQTIKTVSTMKAAKDYIDNYVGDVEPNPISRELQREWDRVNGEQRIAEKSRDYRAIERAKDEVRRVYNEMQEVRQRDRYAVRNNPTEIEEDESDDAFLSDWLEVGTWPTWTAAHNAMIDQMVMSTANLVGRVEPVSSSGDHHRVLIRARRGKKAPLDVLKAQYVDEIVDWGPKERVQRNAMFLRHDDRVYIPGRPGGRGAGPATVKQVHGDTVQVRFDTGKTEWIPVGRIERVENMAGVHAGVYANPRDEDPVPAQCACDGCSKCKPSMNNVDPCDRTIKRPKSTHDVCVPCSHEAPSAAKSRAIRLGAEHRLKPRKRRGFSAGTSAYRSYKR